MGFRKTLDLKSVDMDSVIENLMNKFDEFDYIENLCSEEKAVDEDDRVDEGDSQPTCSKSTLTKRSKRGRTHLHCLTEQKNMGIKKDVGLNELGQPIGKAGTQMQSLIGVWARENVKITYKSWKDVSNDVKEAIWESVNLIFNVDHKWKKSCLISAGAKWRQFKSKLTNYVYNCLETSELKTPPSDCDIPLGDWNDFVDCRLSEDFKKLRGEQKKRISQSIHPYRFSRKWYARHADENRTLLCDDVEINQAILWVEGRKCKGDIHKGDDLREIVAKIKLFLEA